MEKNLIYGLLNLTCKSTSQTDSIRLDEKVVIEYEIYVQTPKKLIYGFDRKLFRNDHQRILELNSSCTGGENKRKITETCERISKNQTKIIFCSSTPVWENSKAPFKREDT